MRARHGAGITSTGILGHMVNLLYELGVSDATLASPSAWRNRSPMHRGVLVVPKVIWCNWFQGWENAPDLVRACATSWERMNKGWCVHRLTMDDIVSALRPSQDIRHILAQPIPMEALSDIVRIELLARFGGVWVDSTTYCLRPLDEWVALATVKDFFAFNRPGPDRLLSTWFIAANSHSYLVSRWRQATREYWKSRTNRDQYFWFHQLFEELYSQDVFFKSVWDGVPKISADGPHCFAPYDEILLGSISATSELVIETAQVPLLKLTHKIDHTAADAGTTYRYLCDRIGRPSLEQTSSLPTISSASVRTRSFGSGSRPARPRILVVWFGTIPGHGTVGDLHAVQSVCARLYARGFSFAHSSATSDYGIVGPNVDFRTVDPREVDVVIFVCGPIILGHPVITEVINRFQHTKKIGVGVSLFPSDAPHYVNPFDVVFAREGQPVAYEDVAIAAPTEPHEGIDHKGTFRIGLVLRGLQHEYGPERCLHTDVEDTARAVIREVGKDLDAETIRIEHRLQESPLSPQEFDSTYARCDLVITSRFHGGILAMRNGVPFIAIDQIVGGAKLSRLLGERGWPHVYRVENEERAEIISAARAMAQNRVRWKKEVRSHAQKIRLRAEETLAALDCFLSKEQM